MFTNYFLALGIVTICIGQNPPPPPGGGACSWFFEDDAGEIFDCLCVEFVGIDPSICPIGGNQFCQFYGGIANEYEICYATTKSIIGCYDADETCRLCDINP